MLKASLAFSARMSLMSTSSVLPREYRLRRLSASALAVSMEVRQGMLRSTALRRIFTQSRVGIRPFEEGDTM